ncbi:hypothetical protein TKK_0016102 [Trichogramma kaykai]
MTGRVKYINQKGASLKGQITQLEQIIENIPTEPAKLASLKARIDRIKVLFEGYEELHDELALLDDAGDHNIADFKNVQERYYNLLEQSVEEQPKTDKGYKRSLQEKSFNNNNKKPRVENHAQVLATNVTKDCLACNKDKHPLYRCSVFRHANLQQRWEIVKKAGVCRNCLVKHEGECTYFRCKKCSDFHNALLHSDNKSFQGQQTL